MSRPTTPQDSHTRYLWEYSGSRDTRGRIDFTCGCLDQEKAVGEELWARGIRLRAEHRHI